VSDAADAAALTPEPMIVDTAERVFAAGAPWAAVESAGLATAWIDEALGGGGARLIDGFAVARAAGRHALALPVAETLLAGFALARAGIALPAGALGLALDVPAAHEPGAPRLDAAGTLGGTVARVAFAGEVERLVVLARAAGGWQVALVAADAVARSPGSGLSGEGRDRVQLDGVVPEAAGAVGNALDPEALLWLAALLRACQMAGALERVLALSLDYARERVQFGRPIARFQAVQHALARLAGECVAAGAAADAGASAVARFDLHDERAARACAAAKIRVGEAAGEAAAIAHQVHGAMGFSQEYALQRFTRRLWTWRDDFGPEAWWAGWLGRRVATAGAGRLWPALTAD